METLFPPQIRASQGRARRVSHPVLPMILFLLAMGSLTTLSGCDWFLSFPKEGTRAPISHNPVLEVGERFGDICTMNVPDHLHRESFSHAIYHHRPILVFFGAPIHCTPCVHEDRIVQGLQGTYHQDMAFIHIDDYEDSEQATVRQWRVHGEPWVAVIDGEGVIRHVIPGDANYYSLNKMVKEILH
jgi:hypothetical protein